MINYGWGVAVPAGVGARQGRQPRRSGDNETGSDVTPPPPPERGRSARFAPVSPDAGEGPGATESRLTDVLSAFF